MKIDIMCCKHCGCIKPIKDYTQGDKCSLCGGEFKVESVEANKEPVANVLCSVGLEGPSEYEMNCAMGLILNSSRNLHYWFMAKNREDMKTSLKLLKEGVERLEKELAD